MNLIEELPDWLDKEAWEAFLDFRKAKAKIAKAPFTELAQKRVLFELDRLRAQGHPSGPVLWQSVVKGWTSVYGLKYIQAESTVESMEVAQTKRLLADQEAHRQASQAENKSAIRARLAEARAKVRGQA